MWQNPEGWPWACSLVSSDHARYTFYISMGMISTSTWTQSCNRRTVGAANLITAPHASLRLGGEVGRSLIGSSVLSKFGSTLENLQAPWVKYICCNARFRQRVEKDKRDGWAKIVSFPMVGPIVGRPNNPVVSPNFKLPLPAFIQNSTLATHTSDPTKVD